MKGCNLDLTAIPTVISGSDVASAAGAAMEA